MTTLDFWRQEGWELGHEKGHEEGFQLGQEKIAINLLQRGNTVTEVAELTRIASSRLAILKQQLEVKD